MLRELQGMPLGNVCVPFVVTLLYVALLRWLTEELLFSALVFVSPLKVIF